LSAISEQRGPAGGDQHASPSATSWLLKLILPGRHGRLLTSILIFCLLLPVFYLGSGTSQQESIPALFFSLVIAYIIPLFSYITDKAQEAMLQLRPLLNLDDAGFNRRLQQLATVRPTLTVLHLGLGAVLGGIHMSLVAGSPGAVITRLSTSPAEFLSIAGALLVWIIMTTVIAMLIHQAIIFARLGRDAVHIELLSTRNLLPFARVSMSSSLTITGALALFPLIGLEIGMDLMQILPGAIATLIPLIIIFIVPVWPVRTRIAALKDETLADLNQQIVALLDRGGQETPAARIDPALVSLLVYRREIMMVSTWPFDLGNIAKLSLYMIIPPLTWVAAALIENLVDAVL